MNKKLLSFIGIGIVLLVAGIVSWNIGTKIDYTFSFICFTGIIIIFVGYFLGRKKNIF